MRTKEIETSCYFLNICIVLVMMLLNSLLELPIFILPAIATYIILMIEIICDTIKNTNITQLLIKHTFVTFIVTIVIFIVSIF